MRAFAADGIEIGILKAQGAWGEIAHDLKLRQEIIRQRGRKRLDSALTQAFLQSYVEQKLAKAKKTRRAASELSQTLSTLAAAPTSASAMQPAAAEPAPDAVARLAVYRVATPLTGQLRSPFQAKNRCVVVISLT